MEYLKKTITKIPSANTLKNSVLFMIVLGTLLGSFAIPFVSTAYAEEPTVPVDISTTLPGCGLGITDESSPGGCLPVFSYYVLYTPTAWLISVAGAFFDRMIVFSLDKDTIDFKFANEGWRLTRDLANIGFILILLYISFLTILQGGGATLRPLVARVIIVALLINFSLFFTMVSMMPG